MLDIFMKIVSFIFTVLAYILMIIILILKFLFDLIVSLFKGSGNLISSIGKGYNSLIDFINTKILFNLKNVSDKHFKEISFMFESKYYDHLWKKYFNISGFIVGLLVVLAIYNAGCDFEYFGKDDKIPNSYRVKKFLNSIGTLTLINSTFPIYNLLGGSIDFYSANNFLAIIPLDRAINPIASLFILIIVSSKSFCRKSDSSDLVVAVYCFATIVYGLTAAFQMGTIFSFGRDLGIFFIVRVISLQAILLSTISYNSLSKRLFVFIPYYFILKIIQLSIMQFATFGNAIKNISFEYIISSTNKYLTTDLIMFGIIVVVVVIHEKVTNLDLKFSRAY